MIEWIEGLPQTTGYYLWHEVTSPHSCHCSVVYIAKLNDYRPEQQNAINEKIKNKDVYSYNNCFGDTLIICWDYNRTPSLKDGVPTCDWAPFNHPLG